MSDGTASVVRSRWRTWIVLLVMLLGLLLAGVAGVWLFLRSDGDLRAFERDAMVLGIDLRPAPATLTEPVRIAHARRIDAMVRAIKLDYPGKYIDWASGRPPTVMFREFHLGISSQAVRDVAREIKALGNEPLVISPGGGSVAYWQWGELLANRILVADAEELDACVMAYQTIIEMTLRDRKNGWWSWFQELNRFSEAIVHRLRDQSERLRPLAEWLEAVGSGVIRDFPLGLEQGLIRDFQVIPSGETLVKEMGIMLPGIFYQEPILDMAFRLERENILRSEFDWLQFVKAHPVQLRAWLDEAERRHAALAKIGSWLTVPTHQQILYRQNPYYLRRWIAIVLRAEVLAAELRGSPWPIDPLDPLGKPMRRWEVGGRLIGAYSVGPDGVDDGGDRRGLDITLRLRPEPAMPTP